MVDATFNTLSTIVIIYLEEPINLEKPIRLPSPPQINRLGGIWDFA
jgi:hypothetical protein